MVNSCAKSRITGVGRRPDRHPGLQHHRLFIRHQVLHRSPTIAQNRGALPAMDEEGLHTGEGLGGAVLRPVLHRHQRNHSEGSLEKSVLEEDRGANGIRWFFGRSSSAKKEEGFRTGGYPLFLSSCPGGKDKSPLSCPQIWSHPPELITLFFM